LYVFCTKLLINERLEELECVDFEHTRVDIYSGVCVDIGVGFPYIF